MALAISGTSPAVATGAPTATTVSFTPPAGAVLLIGAAMDSTTTNPGSPTITDNLGVHLIYTLLDWKSHADAPTVVGQAAMWSAVVVTSAAMTVSVTNAVGGFNTAIKVWVLTGADTVTPIGAHGKSGATGGTSSIAQNYTASQTSGWGFIAVNDDDALGAMTAGTGCTIDASAAGAGGDYAFARRTIADDSIGSTNTLRVTAGGASFDLSWTYAEVLPAAAAVPAAPVRYPAVRDYGEVQWIQRDRRNANLVATPANPLPSPLDTSWQAGGRYWHLTGDAADAAARSWQGYQPRVISDPNLLTPPATDPLTLAAGVGGDTWRRYALPGYADRREVPQQRSYVSNPSMLATALLETELLGGGQTAARYATVATNAPRVWMPQQRTYISDPSMLATALLENELLGGAETAKRYSVPFTNAPRWWMPQQRKRDASTPGLLDSALLENELLGGADTAKRYGLPATHAPRWWMPRQPKREGTTPGLLDPPLLENELLGGAETPKRYNQPASHVDRREVPAQRVYVDQTPFVPPVSFDPLTAAWVATWQAYNQPAIHVERREVPAQRAYISDPAFYPTIAPTDPLTVAWGDGGTYWLRYNTASLYADRREVPQQRRYISDAGLLFTALLENVLLGGADDRWRRYSLPDYADRREVPQQRAYISNPSLLTTALLEDALLGGDTRRQYAIADFWDRRVVPQQPVRNLPTFSVDLDSLLLAWGAGGDLWHRYNPRSDARGWWGLPAFHVLMHLCTTLRPNTGTTTRAASGTTGRLSTGTTGRSSTGSTTRPNTGVTVDPC